VEVLDLDAVDIDAHEGHVSFERFGWVDPLKLVCRRVDHGVLVLVVVVMVGSSSLRGEEDLDVVVVGSSVDVLR